MKKDLLLYILLGFLVIMNGLFLFKHFGTANKNGPMRKAPRNFIARQLEFDASQLQQYEKLDKVHRKKINALLEDIKSSKDALYNKLSDETVNNVAIDSIASRIAIMEKKKELETFHFFKSVGEICTESQRVGFKGIIKDALGRQGPPGGNGPPPRPGGEHEPPPPPGH